jgi:hypothetical protein
VSSHPYLPYSPGALHPADLELAVQCQQLLLPTVMAYVTLCLVLDDALSLLAACLTFHDDHMGDHSNSTAQIQYAQYLQGTQCCS